MSIRGVLQLNKLTLSYCRIGGSSNGMRKFIAEELPKLKESWPAVDIGVAMKNGHHPFVVGEYVHGNTKEVTCRNEDIKGIMRQIGFLQGQYGMPVKKIQHRQRTRRPSIQGAWAADAEIAVTVVP
mmetsp:Transcript_34953/g.58769  ORF Transcript_34953/g.58769 Transcript_34953/m.58769 type:complete len:126 (-) Transcript_34953:291-668(-)|eukprot:CAMPEP_0198206654 /NCGR_PEP_ID=MMETSP1445-20131203/10201_1 /TAXON_ID=36898 /ORGANISM="Pyramimonas sp., Strain CCMP2087" /LENGTH=125 /DNA_ID=CAMNT_0043879431 /DNA_START=124 /DNA_END=501 /DNA_ORIENTATION=+